MISINYEFNLVLTTLVFLHHIHIYVTRIALQRKVMMGIIRPVLRFRAPTVVRVTVQRMHPYFARSARIIASASFRDGKCQHIVISSLPLERLLLRLRGSPDKYNPSVTMSFQGSD